MQRCKTQLEDPRKLEILIHYILKHKINILIPIEYFRPYPHFITIFKQLMEYEYLLSDKILVSMSSKKNYFRASCVMVELFFQIFSPSVDMLLKYYQISNHKINIDWINKNNHLLVNKLELIFFPTFRKELFLSISSHITMEECLIKFAHHPDMTKNKFKKCLSYTVPYKDYLRDNKKHWIINYLYRKESNKYINIFLEHQGTLRYKVINSLVQNGIMKEINKIKDSESRYLVKDMFSIKYTHFEDLILKIGHLINKYSKSSNIEKNRALLELLQEYQDKISQELQYCDLNK